MGFLGYYNNNRTRVSKFALIHTFDTVVPVFDEPIICKVEICSESPESAVVVHNLLVLNAEQRYAALEPASEKFWYV